MQVYSWIDYTYAGPAYNHPPELTYPGVSPESGTTADPYVFSVRYADQDGDSPSVRNVYVDGVAHATTYSASDGRYRWTATGLATGEHSFYFDFEDSDGATSRAPVAGSLVGPQVYAFNLSALSPSSAPVGGGAFTLAVTGSGFVSGSVVTWDGSDRATVFVSATRLEASIPASDLVLGKTVPIVARAPGGGLSSQLEFLVENPAPVLGSISPVRANGGGAAFTLAVTGSNFVSNSSVLWNGVARTTTFINATGLQASIPATDLAAGGEFEVSVNNPLPAGGNSAGSPFTVSDFTVEALPELTTVPAGQSAVFTIQVSPRYGSFDSAISFRALGLPRGCTASFSPATLTPGGAAATTTLTLATTARSVSGAATVAGPGGLLPPGAALLLTLALFLACGAGRRPSFRKKALRPAAAFLLLAILVFLSACGA
ncbi:MAG: cell surface receptor domain protein, partial [Candidatus Aminicenantes bacterium]|nr:cell surface receptor domain protein [Candidatus Aminicenantes bacterium]